MGRTVGRRVDKTILWVAGAGALQWKIASSRHRDKHVRFAATRRSQDRPLQRSSKATRRRRFPQEFATETTNLNTDELLTTGRGTFGKRLQLRRTLDFDRAYRPRICPPQSACFTNRRRCLLITGPKQSLAGTHSTKPLVRGRSEACSHEAIRLSFTQADVAIQ